MTETKGSYLLRVEGVNLASFVYDTDDLSTVRGGGLLLLGAIEEVKGWLEEMAPGAQAVSTGASAGLFTFEASDGGWVRDTIAQKLREHDSLQHGTFVVDVSRLDDPGKFLAVREEVLVLNRFRQMRSPSLAVPKTVDDSSVAQACKVDLVRPGVEKGSYKGQSGQPMSRSVKARRDHGTGQKQEFCSDASKDPEAVAMRFVHDFEALATDKSRGNLSRKMAVLYVDGNHFGRTQDELSRKAADPAEMQKKFDEGLKSLRRVALKSQLKAMRDEPDSWTNGDRYRFETLLWGGDEFCWVVPAWHGWATLARFFEQSRAWAIGGIPLTHAAGLVFCHHKAPIRRVKDLARDLAELAKEKSRDASLCAYQVLESFDDIPQDLEEFRRSRCVAGASADTLLVPGGEMNQIVETLRGLKEVVPRSRLVRAVGLLQRDEKCGQEATEELLATPGGKANAVVEDHQVWLHLAELWDYIGGKP